MIMKHKFELITDVNPHASRAVGILRGRIVPDLARAPRGFNLVIQEEDERTTSIPGVLLDGALDQIQGDPLLLTATVDVLCYPRTVKKDLTIQVLSIAKSKGRYHPDQDFFIIVGTRINTRKEGMIKLAIRPNRTKKKTSHKFERFWLELYGFLNDDDMGVHIVKAVRKGVRLFITESKSRTTGNLGKNHGGAAHLGPSSSKPKT